MTDTTDITTNTESQPAYQSGYIKTSDQLELYSQYWLPDQAVGSIVLVHGLAEHSSRYRETAKALTKFVVKIGRLAVAVLDHPAVMLMDWGRGQHEVYALSHALLPEEHGDRAALVPEVFPDPVAVNV